jgi:hypothetical protein
MASTMSPPYTIRARTDRFVCCRRGSDGRALTGAYVGLWGAWPFAGVLCTERSSNLILHTGTLDAWYDLVRTVMFRSTVIFNR